MVFSDDQTAQFRVELDRLSEAGRVMKEVYHALEERGYNPVSQIVGYLLSGDPTYITTHRGARQLVRGVARDELLEELVTRYVDNISAARQDRPG